MATLQSMNIIAFVFTLFTYQMLSGEGRQMKSLNGVRINYFENPSPRSIRKLGSLIAKSDHSQTSPKRTNPQKASTDFSPTAVNQKKFPALEPARSSPDSSETVNSFEANKVDADVPGNCPGIKCIDDFRPTAPGHSPGAGHSFVTSTYSSPNQLTENPKTNSPASFPNYYQDTKPGHNPGAGHALGDNNRVSDPKTEEVQNSFPSNSPTPSSFFSDSAMVYKNDFRPTSPGSSPGAGHLEANKNDTETTGNCLSEKCTDGFRPTKPGDSPGAGHFVESKSNSITPNQQRKNIDVAHLHEEETDNYRPTTPGHSPGAGHVTSEKN